MNIAFLILTYGNPIFAKRIKKFTMGHNIYIHPKFKDDLDNYFKKFIIKNTIDTKWGDFSLVDATLNMLQEAYLNNNDYYVLLSGDTYPLYKQDTFVNYIKTLNNSCFDFWKKYKNIWKSSQWWILNKQDAEIILNTRDKYKNYFNNIKLDGAFDENYFLTVLNAENNLYKFNNTSCVYTRWLQYTITKHPVYFNKLTRQDIINIKNNNSFFIRKCVPSFKLKQYKIKKILYLIYIGTETNQENIFNLDFNKIDIIIITSLDLEKINNKLIKNCICIYSVLWKLYYESIIDIYTNFNIILDQWKQIIFTTEKFNFSNIYKTDVHNILPDNKYQFKDPSGYKISSKLLFTYLKDNSNNNAYLIN
jgi:hypothetical protein